VHGDHMKHVVKLAEEALNVVADNVQTHLLLTVDGSVQMYLRSQDHAIRTSAQMDPIHLFCSLQKAQNISWLVASGMVANS